MKKPPFQKSLLNSLKGILWILKSERNFQIHVIALVINVIAMAFLKVSAIECALLVGMCILVLVTEALNTCIEKICDFIQPNKDERIRIIKDLAAGAVLLSAIGAVIVGILIYYKYILALCK